MERQGSPDLWIWPINCTNQSKRSYTIQLNYNNLKYLREKSRYHPSNEIKRKYRQYCYKFQYFNCITLCFNVELFSLLESYQFSSCPIFQIFLSGQVTRHGHVDIHDSTEGVLTKIGKNLLYIIQISETSFHIFLPKD